jgi:hypothetical protein
MTRKCIPLYKLVVNGKLHSGEGDDHTHLSQSSTVHTDTGEIVE